MDRQDATESDWLREAGAELEDLDRQTNQPRPPRPAQGMPKREQQKPAEKPEDKPTGETQPQDDDVINPGDEPEQARQTEAQPGAETQQPGRPLKAPELRKAYEETKKRITEELEPKLKQYEARIKELETAGPKDTEETQARIKQIQARNQQLEEFVRLKHYEQSQEYLDKYQKPYEQAWAKCLRDINQLEVEVSDGRGGWVTRKANDGDITNLAQLATTNLGEYIKQSNAMFGDAADIVRKHVERINETYTSQTTALEEAQKRAVELSKNEQNQTVEQMRMKQKLWENNNTELATKFPTYFAPIKGDETGNKLLNAGLAFTDLLFQSGTLTPDKLALLPARYREEIQTKGQLSPELMVRAHAIIRNKAANHDRLARQLKNARAELEQVKKTLAEYESSEPPTDGSSPGRGPAGGGDWMAEASAEIDELDRRGR